MLTWFDKYITVTPSKFCALLLCLSMPVGVLSQTAPELSVVGGFFAGPAPRKVEQLQALALTRVRDGLRWQDIERRPGKHQFGLDSGAHLPVLYARGLLGPILVQPQTPLYSAGQTVTSANDLRAFAQFVRAVADQFPDNRIEIANEFNGGTFVTGPARGLPPAKRARLHARMLAQIARVSVPRDRIIGGALHSMAGGYLWPLLDAGAAEHMTAVAIHPYTTAPEAFPRQLAVLRKHPKMAKLQVDVTEFGTRDRKRAADYFWRYYCQMARAGVRSAHWYPLDPRKDGYAPVFTSKRALTPVGRAVVFAATELAGRPVVPLQPDAHTYGCLFADKLLVLWGSERKVISERDDLMVRHSDGQRAMAPLILSRERVLILSTPENSKPFNPAQDVSFGPQRLLFDSFDQFATEATAPFLTVDGQPQAFSPCPGQDRPQAPWFPHLCASAMPRAVLHDRGFTLPNRLTRFHLPFVMPRDAVIEARGTFDLNQQSKDGVEVTLLVNGAEHGRQTVLGKQTISFTNVTAKSGTNIEVVLSTGPTSIGDRGKFRLELISR